MCLASTIEYPNPFQRCVGKEPDDFGQEIAELGSFIALKEEKLMGATLLYKIAVRTNKTAEQSVTVWLR